MIEESGGSGSAAGLGDDAAFERQLFHRGADLVFSDGDNVVYVFGNILKGNLTDRSGSHAVGDGLCDSFRIRLHKLLLVETIARMGSDLGFHSVDPHFLLRFDRSRDTADESAAADLNQDQLNILQVLEDFKADGSLSGDDVFVIVR